jgi:hypothetical protein
MKTKPKPKPNIIYDESESESESETINNKSKEYRLLLYNFYYNNDNLLNNDDKNHVFLIVNKLFKDLFGFYNRWKWFVIYLILDSLMSIYDNRFFTYSSSARHYTPRAP